MISELDRRTRVEAGEWLSAALAARKAAWESIEPYRQRDRDEAHEHGRAIRWDSRESLLYQAQRFREVHAPAARTWQNKGPGVRAIAARWYHVLAAIYEYAASNAESGS